MCFCACAIASMHAINSVRCSMVRGCEVWCLTTVDEDHVFHNSAVVQPRARQGVRTDQLHHHERGQVHGMSRRVTAAGGGGCKQAAGASSRGSSRSSHRHATANCTHISRTDFWLAAQGMAPLPAAGSSASSVVCSRNGSPHHHTQQSNPSCGSKKLRA